MSETEGLLKKKKLLKTLLYKYAPLQVLLMVFFLYAVIVLINIPINKWLSFNCPQWSNGEYHLYDAFWVLPLFEIISCIIVGAIIGYVYYFFSGIIAYRNYCYIPLTEEEIKNKGFKKCR